MEGTNKNSPISKFIKNMGKGIHHIAFGVNDILAEVKRLKEEGFKVLNEISKKGNVIKLVTFFAFKIYQ